MGGFEPEYYEVRGDLLLASDDGSSARDAYREAVRHAGGFGYLRLLTMKLDDLGSEESYEKIRYAGYIPGFGAIR